MKLANVLSFFNKKRYQSFYLVLHDISFCFIYPTDVFAIIFISLNEVQLGIIVQLTKKTCTLLVGVFSNAPIWTSEDQLAYEPHIMHVEQNCARRRPKVYRVLSHRFESYYLIQSFTDICQTSSSRILSRCWESAKLHHPYFESKQMGRSFLFRMRIIWSLAHFMRKFDVGSV